MEVLQAPCRAGLKFRLALAKWRNGLGGKKPQDTNLEAVYRDRNTQLHDARWRTADSVVVLQKICELELGCARGKLA